MDKQTIEKIPSYNEGLDTILCGGLPAGRTTVLAGGAGTGKTMLAYWILAGNAKRNTPVFFHSFEQNEQELKNDLVRGDSDLQEKIESGTFIFSAGNLDHVMFDGEMNLLEGLFVIVDNFVQTHGVKIIALDAIDILLECISFDRRTLEVRKFISALKELGLTVILTAKIAMLEACAMDYIADCLIFLDQRVENQITTRRIRVCKYRGSDFGMNEYPYVIGSDGLSLLPISSLGMRHKPLGEHVSVGIERLDEMLGGGFRRASSILVAGTPGSSKTNLAATYAACRCKCGEKVLWIDFEQSFAALAGNCKSIGVDLWEQFNRKSFKHISNFPEAMGAEEHLIVARQAIAEFEPDHVVVDAISATSRMSGGRSAYEYTLRLMDMCKSSGITCIMNNQTDTVMGFTKISGIDISSIVDAAIVLSLAPSGAELNRTVLVLKSRGSAHSHQYREFRITNDGLEILDVCLEMDGRILTGTLRQAVEQQTRAERKRKEMKRKHLLQQLDALEEEIKAEEFGRSIRQEMRDSPLLGTK